MNSLLRVDEIFPRILNVLGPVWLVAALLVVAQVAFGKLVRSLMTAIFVLVCTQVWWGPLNFFALQLRWLLLMLLFARGVLYVVRTPAPPGEERTPRRIVSWLAAIALASTLWSDSPTYTLTIGISFCLGLFVVFGLLWRLADDAVVIRNIAAGAVGFAAAAFALGPLLVFATAYVTGDYRWTEQLKLGFGGGRYSGVFYNPNAAGLIGAMLLPVILAAPKEFLGRIAWLRIPVLLVTFATIFMSGSRSALIGSVMSVIILAMYRYGGGVLFTVALGGLAVWAMTVYAPLDDAELDSSAVGHIARTKHLSTLSGRVELWESGWEAAQGHLVFGQGWGMSRDVGGGVDLELAAETGQVRGATNLHNAHLQLLIDLGFVGVSLFWWFCLLVLKSGWRILLAPRSPYNGLALVIFTSALALIADTWVHGAIWSMGSPTTLAFWGLCALSLREGARAHRETLDARLPAWARSEPPPIPDDESPLPPAFAPTTA